MNEWSQNICNVAVPPQTVGQQNLPHHCLSSKPVGLLHCTPYGRLIFGLKSPKAIHYQQLREERVARCWETTKHTSSWENSVFCEASSLHESKRPWFTLGSWQLIREGGEQPPCAQHFSWELLAELMETWTEIAGSNYSSSCKTPRFVSAHQYRGKEHTGTAEQATASKATSGSHQQSALMEKPVERLDEIETKSGSCTKSCTVDFLGW